MTLGLFPFWVALPRLAMRSLWLVSFYLVMQCSPNIPGRPALFLGRGEVGTWRSGEMGTRLGFVM